MPISSLHPQYHHWRLQWRKCRDAVAGQHAIKDARNIYLPQLGGQDGEMYERYLHRALFYGASDRTVKALTGAIMRRPPQITFPGYDEKEQGSGSPSGVGDENAGQATDPTNPHILAHIGSRNEPIQLILKKAVEEVITMGRCGILLDSAPEDASAANPYIAIYYTENIINWGERNVNGRQILEFVVLKEDNPVREVGSEEDQFHYKMKERYRVMMLKEVGTRTQHLWVGLYEQKEPANWDKQERLPQDVAIGPSEVAPNTGEEPKYELLEEYEPRMLGGKPVPFIPFVFLNPSSITTEVEKPPILDLVDVNLSHYQNSADYEHGLHYTALPTAWIAGFENQSRMLIGSETAWVSDNPQAKAGYLEFSGHGLGAIKTAMNDKEKQMAVLGSRLLEEQKADSEAAAAIRLRHSGEESVLQHIVKTLDEGFTMVLKWIAQWTKQAKKALIGVKLNDEFNPLGIDSQTMIVMFNMVQSGKMSYETFFYNLQRGNMFRDGWTIDDEKAAIEAGNPMPPPGQLQEDLQLKGGGAGGGEKGIRMTTPASAGLGSDLNDAGG